MEEDYVSVVCKTQDKDACDKAREILSRNLSCYPFGDCTPLRKAGFGRFSACVGPQDIEVSFQSPTTLRPSSSANAPGTI
jgi:hypothetical protein